MYKSTKKFMKNSDNFKELYYENILSVSGIFKIIIVVCFIRFTIMHVLSYIFKCNIVEKEHSCNVSEWKDILHTST